MPKHGSVNLYVHENQKSHNNSLYLYFISNILLFKPQQTVFMRSQWTLSPTVPNSPHGLFGRKTTLNLNRVSRFGPAVRCSAGKQKDLGSIPIRLSFLCKSASCKNSCRKKERRKKKKKKKKKKVKPNRLAMPEKGQDFFFFFYAE